MDWNRVQGSWKQLPAKSKRSGASGLLTNLTAINGRREELEGKISTALWRSEGSSSEGD